MVLGTAAGAGCGAWWRGRLPRRGRGFQHMVLDTDAGADFAASWMVLLPPGLCRFGGLIHAAGFDIRWPLQALQPGNLFALLADNLLQSRNLAQQFDQQGFK